MRVQNKQSANASFLLDAFSCKKLRSGSSLTISVHYWAANVGSSEEGF